MLFNNHRNFTVSLKTTGINNKIKKSKYLKSFTIFVPEVFNLALLKGTNKKWIVIYNSAYKFLLPLTSTYLNVTFAFTTNIIKLDALASNHYYTTYISTYGNILNSFYKPLFKKIKFRGKGYYIYKNKRNTIAPQFGYSHRLYVYSYFNKVKFIGKTIVILFGLVKDDIIKASIELKSKRPINIFTGRGVRFSRQIVYKKQGKVSSYR